MWILWFYLKNKLDLFNWICGESFLIRRMFFFSLFFFAGIEKQYQGFVILKVWFRLEKWDTEVVKFQKDKSFFSNHFILAPHRWRNVRRVKLVFMMVAGYSLSAQISIISRLRNRASLNDGHLKIVEGPRVQVEN